MVQLIRVVAFVILYFCYNPIFNEYWPCFLISVFSLIVQNKIDKATILQLEK